jgi:hypothetical protein
VFGIFMGVVRRLLGLVMGKDAEACSSGIGFGIGIGCGAGFSGSKLEPEPGGV